jgi:hypothetical protein
MQKTKRKDNGLAVMKVWKLIKLKTSMTSSTSRLVCQGLAHDRRRPIPDAPGAPDLSKPLTDFMTHLFDVQVVTAANKYRAAGAALQ